MFKRQFSHVKETEAELNDVITWVVSNIDRHIVTLRCDLSIKGNNEDGSFRK